MTVETSPFNLGYLKGYSEGLEEGKKHLAEAIPAEEKATKEECNHKNAGYNLRGEQGCYDCHKNLFTNETNFYEDAPPQPSGDWIEKAVWIIWDRRGRLNDCSSYLGFKIIAMETLKANLPPTKHEDRVVEIKSRMRHGYCKCGTSNARIYPYCRGCGAKIERL